VKTVSPVCDDRDVRWLWLLGQVLFAGDHEWALAVDDAVARRITFAAAS
jgi:hypothetical protein